MVWFLAAIVLHDLVLFPLYALADRSLGAGWRAVTGSVAGPGTTDTPRSTTCASPSWPAGCSSSCSFPASSSRAGSAYHNATGLTQAPFLDRWLLITAALFGASAVAYGIRLILVRRRPDAEGPTPDAGPSSGGVRSSEEGSGAEYH